MKVPKFKSLSFKLTVWYVLIMSCLIGATGWFIRHSSKNNLRENVEETTRKVAMDLNGNWRRTRGLTWAEAIQESEARFKQLQPVIQVVELARDLPLHPEEFIHSSSIPAGDVFGLKPGIYSKLKFSNEDEDGLYLSLHEGNFDDSPILVGMFDVHGPFVIQVGIPLKETDAKLGQITAAISLGGCLLLVLASLGGHFIIQKALRPVKSVVQAARQITADDLTLRIDAHGRQDEIGALVDTFNEMIGRLEKSVGKIKRFTADVSHELRTPLTIMRGEVEVCLRKEREREEYRDTLGSVFEETQRLGAIIEDLLLLSRIDAAKKLTFSEDAQLDEIVLRVFENRQPLAREKNVQLTIQKVEPATVKGDQRLLERLMANIVDNAIRYTSAGGAVEIDLEKTNGGGLFRVRDTGIGIPETALPHIFERFYVVDPSRSRESGGAGLGLSIVKSVAELHQASIHVDSKLNGGTVFEVRFPAS